MTRLTAQTLTLVLLVACAARAADVGDVIAKREDAISSVQAGQVELVCSLTAGYGKAVRAGMRARVVADYYESGSWRRLAAEVADIGLGGDNSWFFVGRSAEGLGLFEVAEEYYRKSGAAGVGCHCLGSACSTVGRIKDLVDARLVKIRAAKAAWPTWSEFERASYLKVELRQHVVFHQCYRWSKGVSSAEMRKWVATLAAGAIAGAAASSSNRGDWALWGAGTALSAQATADVYMSIRFPEADPNKGRKFDDLFIDCMESNGLKGSGPIAALSSWSLSEQAASKEVGLRATLELYRVNVSDTCVLMSKYTNTTNYMISPVISVTMFDGSQNTLEGIDLEMPVIYPGKAFEKALQVAEPTCYSFRSAYVSAASDKLSKREITELTRQSISALQAPVAPASPATATAASDAHLTE